MLKTTVMNKNYFTKKINGIEVTTLPALGDNYIYVIECGDITAVVDPAEAGVVTKYLREKQLGLTYILNTHHHYDHVGGNAELKALTRCTVVGPDDSRIPALDQPVRAGSSIMLGPYEIRVLATPGHTRKDISFYMPAPGILWSGDTMFVGGCGRLFECGPEEMMHSLNQLAALPDETLLYCGHDYTADNLKFGAACEPGNKAIEEKAKKIVAFGGRGEPTVPSTIGSEKATNVFLRTAQSEVREKLDMPEATDLEVFTELRRRKDSF